MSDYFDSFQALIEQNREQQRMMEYFSEIFTTLVVELDTTKNTATILREQLSQLTKTETFGITQKYYELKVSYSLQTTELDKLRTENENLTQLMILRSAELERQFLEEKERIREDLLKRLEMKENDLELVKVEYQRKEDALCMKLAENEVASIDKIKQMEVNHNEQLNIKAGKLRDSMQTNVLRTQLRSIKEQFAAYTSSTNEKIVNLETKLYEQRQSSIYGAENTTNESLPDDWDLEGLGLNNSYNKKQSDSLKTHQQKNYVSKYKALDSPEDSPKHAPEPWDLAVNSKTDEKTSTLAECNNKNKPKIFRGVRHLSTNAKAPQKAPPLIELQPSNKQPVKRRRLFDTNDFSYLKPVQEYIRLFNTLVCTS